MNWPPGSGSVVQVHIYKEFGLKKLQTHNTEGTVPYHGADSSWVIIIPPPPQKKSYRAKKGTILVRIQQGTIKICHLNIFDTASVIFSCESGAFLNRYPLSSELETDA